MDGNSNLREELADYSHEAWSGWMRYMLKQGVFNKDGTWTMPKASARRWQRQMQTPYSLLPPAEQASDLAEADKILAIVQGGSDGEDASDFYEET